MKRGHAIFLGLLLTVSSVGVWAVYTVSQIRVRDLLVEKESGKLDLTAENLAAFYKPLAKNIEFLSSHSKVQQALIDSSVLPELAEELKLIANAAQDYDQIRLLDLSGRERLRINRPGNNESIVEDAALLQDKSNRDYFQFAMKLSPDEIYLSPLDLNQENGQIERPFKQVIRCAKRVFSPSGEPIGIVVTNYRDNDFLPDASARTTEPHTMLLSNDGSFLQGPDFYPKFASLVESPSPNRFGDFFPQAWQAIEGSSENGETRTARGVFLWRDITPKVDAAVDGEAMYLVALIPNETLNEGWGQQWLVGLVIPLAGVWLLIGIVAYEVVRRDEQRRLAEQQQLVASELAQQADELRRSNRELEQFAFVASHDLQEPLRKISTFGELLKTEHGREISGDAEQYLDIITDSSNRMRALIEDLLEYSCIDSQGKALSAVDSQAAFEDSLGNIAHRIDETAAEILATTSLPTVWGDSQQMTQLFQNLILNSMKYCKKKPRIRVTAVLEEGFWHFQVADNGIGIKPEYSELVFQVFKRLHTRSEYSGTGIGLAICKRIVERSGGKIWVECGEEEGSVFHFTIPCVA